MKIVIFTFLCISALTPFSRVGAASPALASSLLSNLPKVRLPPTPMLRLPPPPPLLLPLAGINGINDYNLTITLKSFCKINICKIEYVVKPVRYGGHSWMITYHGISRGGITRPCFKNYKFCFYRVGWNSTPIFFNRTRIAKLIKALEKQGAKVTRISH